MDPTRVLALIMLVVILIGFALVAKTAKKHDWLGEAVCIMTLFLGIDMLMFFGL